MAVFPIRLFGDPVLRRRAREVDAVDDYIRKLVTDMTDTMRDAPGVGLAAPQIGITSRVLVWEHEESQGAFVNPVISHSEGEVEDEEGCLSIPGLAYPVVRKQRVIVEGLTPNGERQIVEASERLARIFQHEIDHLDGILFIDRLSPELRKQAKRELIDLTLGTATPARSTPL